MKNAIIMTFLLLVMTGAAVSQEKITSTDRGVFLGEKKEIALDLSSGGKIIINSASTLGGEVSVRSGSERPNLVYQKRLKTPSKAEAAQFSEVIELDIESTREGLIVNLKAPGRAPWSGTNNSGRLDIEISLPDSCEIEFNTAYFDIRATGPFRIFKVSESLSQVEVENVYELTDIRVSNRPLTVKNIRGELSLSNKYSRIKLENIETGDGSADVRNEHGEIIIDDLYGSLDLRTSYDRLVARGLFLTGDRNVIRNISAPIELQFDSITVGECRIVNQYGNIEIEIIGPVDARFICKNSETGRIVARGLEMVPSLVYDNRLEFDVGENTAEWRLTARGNGDITIVGPGTDIDQGE